MIIIYPMLTSSNVSPNILPAICKSVEKYLLVYRMEDMIAEVEDQFPDFGEILLRKVKESKDNILEVDPGVTTKDPNKKKLEDEDEEGKKGGGGESVKIQSPSKDTISVEPTWVKVDTKKGSGIVGVKVLPYIVKSDQEFADLLIDDRKLYGINRVLTALLRAGVRLFWSVMRGVKLPIIGNIGINRQVTGDPTKDIIYASTSHGRKNIFACLNFHDVPDEYFNSPKGVAKLFQLGWGSFIVCDDVDRKAFFCMREFNGLTSVVPYQMLYTSLGKDYAKVYGDIEELKKTSSPFFRFTTQFSKLGKR
jgi:hypothetical protein